MGQEPFIGQVQLYAFNFAPKGWQPCSGQILSIQQNAALFALIGTFYGGNGTNTFALPNFNGKVAIGTGLDGFGNTYIVGQVGGEDNHTLAPAEMAAHTHGVNCFNTDGNQAGPSGGVYAASKSGVDMAYSTVTPANTMNAGVVSNAGGSQPHSNQQPSLGLGFYIATVGIFPSRN